MQIHVKQATFHTALFCHNHNLGLNVRSSTKGGVTMTYYSNSELLLVKMNDSQNFVLVPVTNIASMAPVDEPRVQGLLEALDDLEDGQLFDTLTVKVAPTPEVVKPAPIDPNAPTGNNVATPVAPTVTVAAPSRIAYEPVNAQRESPVDHVHAGKGKGLTGQEKKK